MWALYRDRNSSLSATVNQAGPLKFIIVFLILDAKESKFSFPNVAYVAWQAVVIFFSFESTKKSNPDSWSTLKAKIGSLYQIRKALKVSFWKFLNDRVRGKNQIPALPTLIEAQANGP
jgi:hypothetical protein